MTVPAAGGTHGEGEGGSDGASAASPPPAVTRGVLAPVPDAARLADLCRLLGLDVDVLPVPGSGCLAVPQHAADGDRLVAGLSRALGRADVVQVLHEGDRLRALRWRAGALDEELPAGLVVGSLPTDAERVLLGRSVPGDLPGVVTSRRRSRLSAALATWRGARAARGPRSARR